MAGLGASPHPGIWLAAFADGTVRMIRDDLDPQIVKAMIDAKRRGGDSGS